ncbi:MAG: LysR substrate-binding domain-containing protein [Polyangiaceae bacterium]
MDRFLAMQVFVAVGEAQSFAAAARRLALSPPMVTRTIGALEQQLGVQLLQRTTRIVRLTDAGARYLLDCKRLLSELEDAEQALSGSQAELRGALSITASVMFGRLFVAPILLDFLTLHPKVNGRAVLADGVLDLIEEGLDVGVRIAHLSDASFTAIRVGAVRQVLCASPAYLKRHGVPRSPRDLAEFDTISFSDDRAAPAWSFESGKDTVSVRPRSRLIVNSTDVAMQAAVAGAGVTRVLSYMAAAELKAGRLRVILREFEPEPIPIHVIHREGKQALARVRAFVDLVVERLRSHPLLKS